MSSSWSPSRSRRSGLSRPALRFRIVPRRTQRERAHAAAMRQFLAQGMQKTEGRTGVLIFAAEAERYVEIIADGGINAKVTQEVWDAAVASLIAAIKDGRAADGFVAAIEQCGAVLARALSGRAGLDQSGRVAGQTGGDLSPARVAVARMQRSEAERNPGFVPVGRPVPH